MRNRPATPDGIISRLETISEYLESDYQTDNIQHLLERSQRVLAYMSEVTGLLSAARLIRDAKAIEILERQPNIKITTLRILYGQEATLVDTCKNMHDVLKDTASGLQSQLSAARHERESYLKDKSTT